jgi:hypothetical protein
VEIWPDWDYIATGVRQNNWRVNLRLCTCESAQKFEFRRIDPITTKSSNLIGLSERSVPLVYNYVHFILFIQRYEIKSLCTLPVRTL